jgi:hypothetical protein
MAIPLTRPTDTLSPIEGEGQAEWVRFMESLLAMFAVHWGPELVRVPLNRPPGTFSPTGREGWDEGVRFMESLPLMFMGVPC